MESVPGGSMDRGGSWLLVGLGVLLLSLLSTYKIGNYDIGFHVATGRHIAHFGFPATNVLSFAQPDHAWPLHYGLSSGALKVVHELAGFEGLSVLRVILVLVTFGFVVATAVRLGADVRVSLILGLLGAASAALRFQMRPHLFTYTLTAAFLYYLHTWLADRRSWRLFVVGALAVLGANLHAGAVYMLLLLMAATAHSALRRDILAVRKLAGCIVAVVVFSAISVLSYNPSGLSGLLVPFQFGTNRILSSIILEFQGIGLASQGRYPFYWLLSAASLTGMFASSYRMNWWMWMLTLAAVVGPLRHQRLLFLSSVCVVPVASVCWTEILHRRDVLARLNGYVCCGLMSLLAFWAVDHYWETHEFGLGLNKSEYPEHSLAFVGDQDVGAKVFTSDVFSGAYLQRFYPLRKVFYDNRMEAYDLEFISRVYLTIESAGAGWRTLVDRYELDGFLIKYNSASAGDSLSLALAADHDFCLVHFDDVSMVWIRRHSPDHTSLARYCYQVITPDRFSTQGSRLAALEADLREAMSRPDADGIAFWYAALLLKDTGRPSAALQVLSDGLRHHPSDARLLSLEKYLRENSGKSG